MRHENREADQLRSVKLIPNFSPYAEGSCMAQFGNTHVLCTASVDSKVPPFLRNTGKGWVTAEYGMLPRSTHDRMDREASKGKQSGRTQEIQRLIGRALRAVVQTEKLGEIQIKIDCDVIQADGGTRTAAITGAYVALHQACLHLQSKKLIKAWPLVENVAAISCGIIDGLPCLDLDYKEDSNAHVDANFVLTATGKIVEIQATAESVPFDDGEFNAMLLHARKGIAELIQLQNDALKV